MKGRGINNLLEFPDPSPSPRPSPVKGEGVFLTFYDFIKIDDLVKSLKRRISVIPANPGSGPGQAPESSYFKYLKILWTPVSTGVTTYYRDHQNWERRTHIRKLSIFDSVFRL
jgi:hypothetical protein